MAKSSKLAETTSLKKQNVSHVKCITFQFYLIQNGVNIVKGRTIVASCERIMLAYHLYK